MSALARKSWQDAEREANEIKAEAIDGALHGLGGLEGMFEGRELRGAIASVTDLLLIEASNLRKVGQVRKPAEVKAIPVGPESPPPGPPAPDVS